MAEIELEPGNLTLKPTFLSIKYYIDHKLYIFGIDTNIGISVILQPLPYHSQYLLITLEEICYILSKISVKMFTGYLVQVL